MTTSWSAPPPSPQEVQRKLSVHSTARPKKVRTRVIPSPHSPDLPHNLDRSELMQAPLVSQPHISGTESESDSVISPDLVSPTSQSHGSTGAVLSGSFTQPPLSSIAERRSGSGEESDEDEEEEEGGWRTAHMAETANGSVDEKMIKSGYLWKKGERRKTWKKRWFVLRPAHLAYYKTNAEYQLLRLLDLSDVHSCTPVTLKKHNTFSVISTVRTFYLQAESPEEVHRWVQAIQGAKEALMTTLTQTSLTTPIPIPGAQPTSRRVMITHSPPQASHAQNITSSDSEDASPSARRTYSTSSPNRPAIASSPTRTQTTSKEASKIVLSGYLMKCGSKRHNWRKRWFVLNGEKLVYSGSHMDTKPHRQFSFSEILDALEFDMRTHKHSAAISPPSTSPLSSSTAPDDSHGPHTFKIVTTKRTLLLCAPSEEEEIKWLSAVRALIARRSGAGVVPGELSGSVSSALKPAASGVDANQGLGSSSGLRHKVRNLSISGSSGFPSAPISED